jgi:hypothetical protein
VAVNGGREADHDLKRARRSVRLGDFRNITSLDSPDRLLGKQLVESRLHLSRKSMRDRFSVVEPESSHRKTLDEPGTVPSHLLVRHAYGTMNSC